MSRGVPIPDFLKLSTSPSVCVLADMGYRYRVLTELQSKYYTMTLKPFFLEQCVSLYVTGLKPL